MELEVLRNWNRPKTYTGGDVSLTTPQHELIASPASGCIIISLVWKQLRFCKWQTPWNPLSQICFHSWEDGTMATPSQSAQICFRGKQWSNCSSHTPGKERVDFPMFSTLIKLAPMNANLESTWKWAFPFNKNMQLAGTLHPLPVPGKRGSTAFGAPGDNAISNPCHYRQQAFSVFRVILIYHPWALIKFIQWNSENTQDILIYIILLYVKGPSTTHDAQGVSANTRSLPFLSGHSTLYSSCLKSHETSHQPHFPLH